jgi:hypothetical protein
VRFGCHPIEGGLPEVVVRTVLRILGHVSITCRFFLLVFVSSFSVSFGKRRSINSIAFSVMRTSSNECDRFQFRDARGS